MQKSNKDMISDLQARIDTLEKQVAILKSSIVQYGSKPIHNRVMKNHDRVNVGPDAGLVKKQYVDEVSYGNYYNKNK